jgi:small subunit ribosomal protein S1
MTSDTPPIEPTQPTVPEEDAAASAEFARALDEFEQNKRSAAAAAGAAAEITVGMKVKGTVVSVGEEHTLLDFGGRSEAVAETRHFRAEDGTPGIKPGDVLELFVVEAGDQVMLAPSIRPDAHEALRQMREAHAAGVPVSGRVTGVNTGGLEVDLSGERAFCPLSHIDSSFCADPSVFIGRTLEFLVTSVGDAKGSVVLSRRQLLRRGEEEQAKKLVAMLKPGDELDGTVARLEAFGAFVDLGGVDGLVHVSEIRHERVGHPSQVLRQGEKVHVKVLRLEVGKDGRQRIALSIKATAPDPWTDIESRYSVGMRVMGLVARLTDFGAFVTLEPGIDGLVHVSEAAPQRLAHVKEVLTVGQTIEAVVLSVDPEKKRVSLSIKRTAEDWVPPAAEQPRERASERSSDRSSGRGMERGGGGTGRGGERSGGRGGERGSGRGGERGGERGGRNPQVQVFPPPAQPGAGPELTTMALALRAAMERAKQKQEGGGSS